MAAFLVHTPQLLVAVFVFFLAFLVLRNNYKSGVHIGFFVATFSTSQWLFFYFLAYLTDAESIKYLYFKIGYTFVIFMVVSVYHFISAYLKLKREVSLSYFCYGIGLFFAISLWTTDYFISADLIPYKWGLYPKAAVLQKIYMIFFGVILTRFQILLVHRFIDTYKSHDLSARTKMKFVFWSIFFLCVAAMDFLPNYGVPLYPLGYVFAALYSSTMAYAIARHQLLDIEVLIRRTAVFAGLFVAANLVFVFFTSLAQLFFEEFFSVNRWMAMLPSIAVVILMLRPLEDFLIRFADSCLFKKKYRFQDILTELNVDAITRKGMDIAHQTLHPLSSSTLLLDDKEDRYVSCHANTSGLLPALSLGIHSKTVKCLLTGKEIISLENRKPPIAQKELAELHATLAVPLLFEEKLLGLLLLGKKKSGQNYSSDDLDFLQDLAKTQAIALANAQANEDLARDKTRKHLGDMASGMGHQLNNRFAVISGTLQVEEHLMEEALKTLDGKSPEEQARLLKDVLLKAKQAMVTANQNSLLGGNIARAVQAYAKIEKEGSKLNDFAFEEISKALPMATAFLGLELKDFETIEIKEDITPDLPRTWMSLTAFQEIFKIPLQNAYEAIQLKFKRLPSFEGKIEVSIAQKKSENAISIKIEDNGQGMEPKTLEAARTGVPYYTTQGTGGQKEGHGKNLFRLHQLVKLHGGTLRFESVWGEGAVLFMDFPVRGKV